MPTTARPRRPEPDEYVEYYNQYIRRVPGEDALAVLETQADEFPALFQNVTREQEDFRYSRGKWSIKEVVQHLVDIEWVFIYRALSFARGEEGPLPSVDQDKMLRPEAVALRELPEILQEFRHLRAAATILFASFDEETLSRRGVASGYAFTVRAIPFIIAGHTDHHAAVLRERYGLA